MTSARLARVVLCGIAACLVLGPARPSAVQGQGQSTPPATPVQQPTFRATAALVEVDIVTLDGKGNFVPGLVADDLSLYEDGKAQSIQQFYMITHDISARGSIVSGDMTASAEDRARRIFVLMFDEGSLANDSMMRIKAGAERFISEQMGPGDVGGVFVNGSMYRGRLSSDRSEMLSGVRSVKPGFETRQSLLAPFREFPRIPGEIDAVRIADGARDVADMLGEIACREDPAQCLEAGGLNQVENLIQQKARLYVRQARVLTGRTVQNLQYVLGGLSRIPGRKTVVFLSEGFYIEESRATLQNLAAQAARGGTAIYSIDGRGNVNHNAANPDVLSRSMSRGTAFDTGDDGPTILTSGTGGVMLRGIDDVSRALSLVARDTSSYYVIGYAPDNVVMDGKYRRIEVKTRVPDLHIRARKGYLAVTLPPLLQQVGRGGR